MDQSGQKGVGGESGGANFGLLILATLVLYLIWCNSFIAISYLLGAEGQLAQFDWIGLVAARYGIVVLVAGIWLGWRERQAAWAAARAHPVRLGLCSLLIVPAYNFALCYGQQNGLPAPVASLMTAISPLLLLLMGAAFLGEQLSPRRLAGFGLGLAGLICIALARESGDVGSYGRVVAITALAPVCWSLFSVISKPALANHSPLVWTWLSLFLGGLTVVPILPWRGGAEMLALDGSGWFALLYLAVACAFFCFGLWTWLLKHLPASTVGFTVFLNPPMTTATKLLLAASLPAVFPFQVVRGEILGGVIVMAGMAVALTGRRRRSHPAPGTEPSAE